MACHRLGLFRPGQSQRKNRPLSTPVARPSLTTSSQSAHVCVFASPSAAAANPLVRRAHAAGLRSPDRGVAARSLGPKGFFWPCPPRMPLEPRQPPLRLRAGPFVSVQRDFGKRKVFFFATRLRPCPCSRKNDPHLGPSTSLRPTLFMLLDSGPGLPSPRSYGSQVGREPRPDI